VSEVDLLRALVEAEHAAIYGYGVLRTPPGRPRRRPTTRTGPAGTSSAPCSGTGAPTSP